MKEKDKLKEQHSLSSRPPRILPASLSPYSVQNEPASSSFPKLEPAALTPYPGMSPIPIDNKFNPLGSTLGQMRPNYQSVLASSYDPYPLPPNTSPLSSSTFRPRSSPYVSKCTTNLFVFEPHIPASTSPATIALNHFPPGFHYLPHSPYKSLKYYREILLETKSVDIKPIRDKLPYWFLHWWDTHGPVSEIIPSAVTELITTFSSRVKIPERDLFFPMPLLFCTRYKIPWIMKWNYHADWEKRFFSRHFSVKWWDRFETHRISEYFARDFPALPPKPEPKPKPSSSQSSQISTEGKSKVELKDLAKQLLLQAEEMQDDDEDNVSESSSSCQPLPLSPSPDRPMRWSDYPHGQDPNEAYSAYDLNYD
ncbi:unnamed protein product [Prunus armeniaca]